MIGLWDDLWVACCFVVREVLEKGWVRWQEALGQSSFLGSKGMGDSSHFRVMFVCVHLLHRVRF